MGAFSCLKEPSRHLCPGGFGKFRQFVQRTLCKLRTSCKEASEKFMIL